MKKIFITIFTLCLTLTTFAAMNSKVFECKDTNLIKEELKQIKAPHIKMYYEFQLLAIENPKIYDNWESFSAAAWKAGEKVGFPKQNAYSVQLLTSANKDAYKFKKDAVAYNPYTHYAILNLYKSVYKNETPENIWKAYSTALLKCNAKVNYIQAVNVMLANDLDIDKETKIKVYSKLYEKWYMELAGKYKDRYTVSVTRIALKLKSLGYDVNKPNI
jgi:hypothetical protein